MAFKKGVSGNKKGKPAGSQNKIGAEAKALFVFTFEKQVPNLELAFEEVLKSDKIKYLELFAKYAQYFVPKKTDVTSKGESVGESINKKFTIEIIPPIKE